VRPTAPILPAGGVAADFVGSSTLKPLAFAVLRRPFGDSSGIDSLIDIYYYFPYSYSSIARFCIELCTSIFFLSIWEPGVSGISHSSKSSSL
jgi:hypothetical protein